MSSGDDVIDLVEKRSVSLSELDFHFGDFDSQFLVNSSLLDDVMVQGDGLNFLLEGGELFNPVFDLLFDCKLNKKKRTSSSSD
jgi:hypothetical protein